MFFYVDIIESIRASLPPDAVEDAKALIETSRQKMTGREIEICERIASTEHDEFDPFDVGGEDMVYFESMKIQFAREIARWKDGVPA